MDNQVLAYLHQDYLNNLDLIYALSHGAKIVGFAGIHDEGTIGLVEVIDQYRRQGIAQMLETYLMDKLIKSGELVYLQVEVDNESSMRLHEKLGYQRGDDIITWYM